MTSSVVESYFRSHQSSLYLWADEGRALSWLDGTTIAFRPELVAVFDRLSNGSLPPFPSIIVAVAATRTSWPDVAEKLTRLVRALIESELPTYGDAMEKHRYLTDTWPATRRRLEGFSRYAASRVQTPVDRAELLATLFDGFESSFSQTQQSTIASEFKVGLPEDWFFERKGDGEKFSLPSNDAEEAEWRQRPPIFHRILHDVLEFLRIAKVLASNLHDWDQGNLQRRTETGVAFDIAAPESPLEEPMSARDLLSSLQDDAELSGFARMTRSLIAAVSLPRSLEASDDIPAGGVSDISNRGRLDQLLLTELAFDDLTLAIRIATNEAMYIRRESPPNPQVQSRPVFIDTSLPMWGIPKLYATAMAMALTAQDCPNLSVECYRADGSNVVVVPLASRDDIAQHLATLATSEHPGWALAAFEKAVVESSEATEPVLITTGDVLDSPSFQHLLGNTTFPALWIIQVERDGQLQVMFRTRQGTSIRKKIDLPVEEILNQQDAESVKQKGVPNELPDILRLKNFPLRLSYVPTPGRVFMWCDNAVSITNDGRMLFWDQTDRGAVQLADNLSSRSRKPPQLVARDEQMIQILIPGIPSKLVTVYRRGMEVQQVELVAGMITAIGAIGSTLFLKRQRPNLYDDIVAVDRTNGNQLASCPSPQPTGRQHLGRIFRVNDKYCVVYYDGTQLAFQPLPDEFQSAKDVLEYETGKYIQITSSGQLSSPDGAVSFESHRLQAVRFQEFLPGGFVVNAISKSSTPLLWRLSGKLVESHFATLARYEFTMATKIIRNRTPHWKFRRIGLETTTGRIRLQSNKGADHVIRWNSTHKRIELAIGGQHNVVQLSPFDESPGVDDVGYKLKLAEWDGGNKAWLDSRGLLHLKSGNVKIPQITLVLQDGQLSGWLSTGEVFGEDYFLFSSIDSIHSNIRSSAVRVSDVVAWEKCIKPFLDSGPWNFHYSFDTASTGNTTLPHY